MHAFAAARLSQYLSGSATHLCAPVSGLGDQRGDSQDMENIIKVGKYIDEHPVHCILLVVQASNPRVNNDTKGLLNILATKIASKDYAKLGIIINAYNHHEVFSQSRSINHEGKNEGQIRAYMKEQFADSLRGEKSCWYSVLPLSSITYADHQLAVCMHRLQSKSPLQQACIFTIEMFFVTSHWHENSILLASAIGLTATLHLSTWCRLCSKGPA